MHLCKLHPASFHTYPHKYSICVFLFKSFLLNITSKPCYIHPFTPLFHSPSSRPSQPLLDRSIPDFNTFSSVEDWLAAIKMSQYRDNFLNSGFTSLQLVAQMTSEWVHSLVRNEEFQTHMALDGHTCIKWFKTVSIFSTIAPSDSSILTTALK